MRSAESFRGTTTLVRLILRRDRIRLPVWLVSIIGLLGVSANAVQSVYATPRDRLIYAETVGNSTGSVALAGPPVGLRTIGGVTVFETSVSGLVAIALMAVFLTVRHTRAEEEADRTELMRAGRLGRLAAFAAAGLTVGTACLLAGVAVAAVFVAQGLPAAGSWAFGASIAVFGMFFTAVGLLTAQVSEHARAATGGATAFLAVAFVLRAVGDVGWAPLMWSSPMGWSQAVHPYVDDRWWPLLFSLAASAAIGILAAALLERRDLGAGLLPSKLGAPAAGPHLASAWGLAVRLQRASVVSWAVGVGLGGVAFGSISGDLNKLIEDRPELRDALVPGGGDITDGYLATTALVLALIAGGFTLASALRLRSEETAGRVELLVATRLSRLHWAGANIAFTAAGTAAVLVVGGIGLGASSALATGDAGRFADATISTVLYLPASLFLSAVAVFLVGWLPHATAAAWALLTASFVIGYLGGLLKFPTWVLDVSPYTHTPSALVGSLTPTAPLILLSLAAVTTAVGLVGLRHRDLG